MKQIQWNLWARAWVLAGCWTGAMFAVSLMWFPQNGKDGNGVPGPYMSYYLWAISVVLFPFFWPIKQLGGLRILTSHHLVCAIICTLIAPFCYTRQPSAVPGFCWSVAAALFYLATFRGEKRESLDELRGKAPAR